MTMNEGGFDRTARVVVGLGLLAATYLYLDGTWAWVAGGIGAVALITGAVGVCPAYALMGLNTCPFKPHPR